LGKERVMKGEKYNKNDHLSEEEKSAEGGALFIKGSITFFMEKTLIEKIGNRQL